MRGDTFNRRKKWSDSSVCSEFFVVVEIFAPNPTIGKSSPNVYGFENIVLDEIQVTVSGGYARIDNLQFTTAVPIPCALWLIGANLIGVIGMRRRQSRK
jgi:hypothetical protein